jgi:hypothetical protein
VDDVERQGMQPPSAGMTPQNADRRPDWLKEKIKNSGNEVAGVNASSFEVLCCCVCDGNSTYADADVLEIDGTSLIIAPDIEITEISSETEFSPQMTDAQCSPTALKLLSDANIWIGDTGASVDMTPVAEGLMDTWPCQVSVHVGNSQHVTELNSVISMSGAMIKGVPSIPNTSSSSNVIFPSQTQQQSTSKDDALTPATSLPLFLIFSFNQSGLLSAFWGSFQHRAVACPVFPRRPQVLVDFLFLFLFCFSCGQSFF